MHYRVLQSCRIPALPVTPNAAFENFGSFRSCAYATSNCESVGVYNFLECKRMSSKVGSLKFVLKNKCSKLRIFVSNIERSWLLCLFTGMLRLTWYRTYIRICVCACRCVYACLISTAYMFLSFTYLYNYICMLVVFSFVLFRISPFFSFAFQCTLFSLKAA